MRLSNFRILTALAGLAISISGLAVFTSAPAISAVSGCADWPSGKFIQTPWGRGANGGTGWSQAGPSYYNDGFHVHCNEPLLINQYYALDFPLEEGDPISAPAPGKVIWAGWTNGGWSNLGRIVVVDLGDGYWSMSAHLSSIDVSVGEQVSANTVIGKVGASGNYQEHYWPEPHLHQSIFLNAKLDSANGGIYGGQSVEMHNVHYVGNGGGIYPSISKFQKMSW
ncbi:MAG: M23 family metallopeptidase [Stigonema ocellatum SAG 48.90 = DSM 106950]|nr:M23 family metallopeptidase [Stigonema ocellatum SAG 48.90 = DSM 106950]